MLFQNRILLWEKGKILLMFTSPCKVQFLCALTFNTLKYHILTVPIFGEFIHVV